MSFLDWIQKQEDKDRCGRWPFNLPSWIPFTDMCKQHDKAYEMQRSKFLKQNHAAHSVEDLEKRLEAQKYKEVIERIDAVFYARMMEKVQKQSGLRMYIYWATAETFRAVVGKIGYRVWKYGTIKEWLKAQS